MNLFIRNTQTMKLSEVKRMQFLAGIISENNMDPLAEEPLEASADDVNMDAIYNLPQVDMAAEMIMQNPHALEQLKRFAQAAGVQTFINEMVDDEITIIDVQKLADMIARNFVISESEDIEGDVDVETEPEPDDKKVDLMMTGASLGGIIPFIPGISGWFADAAAVSGIPAIALGAGAVIAGAIIGSIIKKIKEKE
jgi:hypothetical protein